MKKYICLLALCLFIPANTAISEECPICQAQIQTQVQCCEVLDTIRKERHSMYNALNLTEEQVKCVLAIEKKVEFELDSLFLNLCMEHGKLEQLKCEKAERSVISAQKEKVKCIENEIDRITKACDKEFEATLSCDQLAKYHMLKKLEKNDLKALAKPKKVNPDVRIFGQKPAPRHVKPCRKPKIFSHVE